jgi:type I restriction enzyme, R subunit
MPVNISEANLETIITNSLTGTPGRVGEPTSGYTGDLRPGGYLYRTPDDYDRRRCLDGQLALRFIQATQPQTWAKYLRQFKKEAESRFLDRLAGLVERHGSLTAFRKGFKDSGCQFKLVYFHPHSSLNPEQQQRYEGNLFSVIRQLRYRPETDKSQPELDLTLFLNGLPIFTAELKNQFTGQTVEEAIHQYQTTRSSRETLFQLGRCLAHFAVDNKQVYFTTHLRDQKTRFFPFNKGYNQGAGNPPAGPTSGKFPNAYLWEEIWARDSVLNLIDQFIHIYDEEDDEGRKTGQQILVFPRYHQLEAVRRLIRHARALGPGQRYLIQHSAGSGKTMTISWLAHQLASLHDEQNRRIFDSIIVITDRRVLDRQLQTQMRQFEQTRGMVENIDKTSRQLKEALESGKHIIVTTLQKFPVIARQVEELAGQQFAVIVDEAHSSQSGASTQQMNRAITPKSLDDAETAEAGEPEDMEDVLIREAELRQQPPHVSTFAFTATPKPKTLQLFGTPQPNGEKHPFSLYAMRQAIEEGFILDVLQNYTTYTAFWNLRKKIEDDPRYDKRKATYLIKDFVDSHEESIRQKVAIMVEHFAENVAHQIDGQAKAMIVTRSRLHAVYYRLAVDAYLAEKGYPFRALVAFSGKVKDPKTGLEYSEPGMNSTPDRYIPETGTADTFNQSAYRLLIVASKYQTGFDQPLLHTMYVDKKLGGVNAVQTLSRLNRIYPPHKTETMVLDFVNAAEDIQKSFADYYETTILSEETDPNVLYELQHEIEEFHFYSEAEVDAFVTTFFTGPNVQLATLYNLLKPVEQRFEQAHPDEQYAFRGKLRDFVRLYAFLSQIATFAETDWEKLFHFGRLLLQLLPPPPEGRLPIEVQQAVDLTNIKVRQSFSGSLSLPRGQGKLGPVGRGLNTVGPAVENPEPLSKIIAELNDIFGIKTNGDALAAIEHLQEKLADDPGLAASVRVNTEETARLTFDHIAQDLFEDLIDNYFKFYKQVTDDQTARSHFFDWLFEQYLQKHGQEQESG